MSKYQVLQLCCFTNHWGSNFDVCSVDVKMGSDVLELDILCGSGYDFVLSAPPCTQFTKANQQNWVDYPSYDIRLAKRCLEISELSGRPWILENPPGRIEKLIPELTKYRRLTLFDITTNKEWVLYSNMLLFKPETKRYGRKCVSNGSKNTRLAYPKYFIDFVKYQLYLSNKIDSK